MGNKNQIIQDLRNQIEALKSGGATVAPGVGILNNSLSNLVASASMQSNLTSMNGIIQNNVYYPVSLNYVMLMYMYKTHGEIQTAIDMPALDAFRGGLEFTSRELDASDWEEFSDWLEEKRVLGCYCDAIIWKRLFGGSALIINAKSDFTKPLNISTVKADGLEFYDACRWELGAPNMVSPKYSFYGKELDASRVLVMSGKRAPFIIRNQLSGWGMSEIERMVEEFNLYLRTNNVLYEILDEAKLDVYKLDGYRDALASPEGTTLINQAISLTNQLKNFRKALVLDKEDDYEQKQLSFSGLAEIKKENRIGLASALRMPITKLFGISASGFNSGEDDIENYNAMVESEVREPARPMLRKVLKLCVRAFFGDDYDFDFKFKPLRMMTSQEEEQIKASKQARVETLYDRGLLSSKEVGDICHKDGLVTIDTAMARGELDEHPMVGMGPDGEGGGAGADGSGEEAGVGNWHKAPRSGKMRRKLKSGRYEYKAPGGGTPSAGGKKANE